MVASAEYIWKGKGPARDRKGGEGHARAGGLLLAIGSRHGTAASAEGEGEGGTGASTGWGDDGKGGDVEGEGEGEGWR